MTFSFWVNWLAPYFLIPFAHFFLILGYLKEIDVSQQRATITKFQRQGNIFENVYLTMTPSILTQRKQCMYSHCSTKKRFWVIIKKWVPSRRAILTHRLLLVILVISLVGINKVNGNEPYTQNIDQDNIKNNSFDIVL